MALTRSDRDEVESLVAVRRCLTASQVRAGRSPLTKDEVALVQRGAVEHPSARVRCECLGVLDHQASDESTEVFRAAVLRDPVPRVRVFALHGLACERCSVEDLCVEDAVGDLIRVLESDDNPKVRHEAVFVLARLGRRDARAGEMLMRVAECDDDSLVREVALAAVEGRGRDVRSRKALRRRARGGRRPVRTAR
jgi:HEAT repeat protein